MYVHNKVGSNVKEFDFNAMNTKTVGLDSSDIYAQCYTLQGRNLTTCQKNIKMNETSHLRKHVFILPDRRTY